MEVRMAAREQTDSEAYSIAEARSELPRLVREAEGGRPVRLTRRGAFVAVIVGRAQYEQWTSPARRFANAYADFARSVDLAALSIDPDDVFAEARARTGGRDVSL
jgi:prevent-host-death family protein